MPVLRNAKHERFAQAFAKGESFTQSALTAGYSASNAPFYGSKLAKRDQIIARIGEIRSRVADKSEWDAARVLIRLGEQADADLLDLHNEDGSFKPVQEWPLVWRQMIQGIEVEQKSVRSSDGVQAGDSKSWDKTSDRIIKIKFIDRLKNLELLGRHKAIDAFVAQKSDERHLHVHVHQEVTQRLQAALHREKAIEIEAHVSDS